MDCSHGILYGWFTSRRIQNDKFIKRDLSIAVSLRVAGIFSLFGLITATSCCVTCVCVPHKQHKLYGLLVFLLLITDADGQEGVEQIQLRRIAIHHPQLRQYYLYYSIWRIRMAIFKILNANLLAPSFFFFFFFFFFFSSLDPRNMLHFGGVDKHRHQRMRQNSAAPVITRAFLKLHNSLSLPLLPCPRRTYCCSLRQIHINLCILPASAAISYFWKEKKNKLVAASDS